MRFADASWLQAAVALLSAVALVGCSSVGDAMQSMRGSLSSSKPDAKPQAPVDPQLQRAFDDATRLLATGRTQEAERAFRALAQSNPDLAGAHANLGLIARQSGKLDDATRELEHAVQLSPRQPVYRNQLAITYRQQGRFADAKGAYEKAIEIDPAYAPAIVNLGILCDLYLGDAPRATELYGRYLQLQPGGDAQVTKWLAELKNRKGSAITVTRKDEKP